MILSALCVAVYGLKAGSLDGASGRLFKPDPLNRSFELLKETEYDPKTDIGQSRFTVHWSENAEIIRLEERKDFSDIAGPIAATFKGIPAKEAKACDAGEPFVARVVTLFDGFDPPAAKDSENTVTGNFWPSRDGSRSGEIEIDGNRVAVSLRDRNWRIFCHKRITPEALAEGFWSVTLHGAEDSDGRFVASRLDVQPMPDPRLTDDPNLPRVLMIGDSISMNYHDAAREALKGVANYHRIEGNGFSVQHGVDNAELWLGNYFEKGFHWDVILFNHGLHDLKQAYDKETDTFGAYAVPLEDYQAGLHRLIDILKRTGAELVWTTTTPIPNHNKGRYARRKGAAKLYNEAAMEVIRQYPEVAVNDLYALVDGSSQFDDWRKGTDVHFYKEEERDLLGSAVAAAVRTVLSSKGRAEKKLPLPGEVFSVEGHTAFLIRP